MDDQPLKENGSVPPPPSQPKANFTHRSRSVTRRLSPRRSSANPVVKWISWFFGLLGLVFGSLYRLFVRLFRGAGRREFRHLLQGMPALLMFGGVLYASTMISLHRGEFLPTYKQLALEAGEAGRYEEALLYFQKLKTLDGGSAASRYAYAMTLDAYGTKAIEQGEQLKSEDEAEARTLIQTGQKRKLDALATIYQIAPEDEPGFPQAHLHLARMMLSNPRKFMADENGKLRPGGVRTVKHHLDCANNHLAETLALEMAYFQFHVLLRQIDEAVKHLEILAKSNPHFYYDLMGLYARLGRADKVKLNRDLASDFYEDLVRKSPDNHIARTRCAHLRLYRQDFAGAVKMLENGLVRADPEKNPYPALLAQTNVMIYDVLTRKGNVPIEQRLAHLRQALFYVTDFRPALARLAQLVMQPGDAGKEIETMLNRMIAQGRMPATGHFALGTKAWKDEDVDKALWHLERAYELEPELGHIGNNLAWMMADQDPPDLDRALKIINSVLETFPNIATFHDTKGYILMKRGEWENALTELEIALPEMRDNIDLHRSLATVYRKLGKPELADEHERIVQELEKAARIAQETAPEELLKPELLQGAEGIPEIGPEQD